MNQREAINPFEGDEKYKEARIVKQRKDTLNKKYAFVPYDQFKFYLNRGRAKKRKLHNHGFQ